MTDAIELLRRDHDEVRALLAQLEMTQLEASTGQDRADERERRRALVLRVAGRIAGATDRIRDALAGRSGH